MSYPQRTVEVVDSGLVIDQSATLLWQDIRKAFIYHAETGNASLTCAEFILTDGYSVEINSQMPGWDQALQRIETRVDHLVDER